MQPTNMQIEKLCKFSFLKIIAQCKIKARIQKSKSQQKQCSIEAGQKCKFQPEDTKKLIKNVSNFNYPLKNTSQKKNKIEAQINVHLPQKNTKDSNKKVGNSTNMMKTQPQKQIYTQDIKNNQPQQLNTEKKQNNKYIIFQYTFKNCKQKDNIITYENQQQNWKLMNNYSFDQLKPLTKFNLSNEQENKRIQLSIQRKTIILETIVKYLSIKPCISVNQFTKIKNINRQTNFGQISEYDINKNPYLPNFIKQILTPITDQLRQVQISLNYQEFLIALETLLQYIDMTTKGKLLEWGIKLLVGQK